MSYACCKIIKSICFIALFSGTLFAAKNSTHLKISEIISRSFHTQYGHRESTLLNNRISFRKSCSKTKSDMILKKVKLLKENKTVYKYHITYSEYYKCSKEWREKECYAFYYKENSDVKFIDLN